MPFVPVPAVALAEVRMLLFGQQIENTLYFKFGGSPTTLDMNGLGDDLIDWWDLQYSQPLSTQLTLREIAVTSLVSATAPAVVRTPSSPLAGKDDAPASPGNVALAISFRTVNRGRSFRGRNFIPGIPNDQITGNTVASGVVEAIEGAYADLLTRHSISGDGAWVVVSRFTAGAPRTTGVATDVTSASVVDPLVDSQRRRLTGRGL